MIGPLASWVMAAAQESLSYDDRPSLSPWQKCARCGFRVDLPEAVLKAADRAYCSPECVPPTPHHGQIDVSHLRPMVRR